MALQYDVGTKCSIIPLTGDVVRNLTTHTGPVREYTMRGKAGFRSGEVDGICIGLERRDAIYTHPDLAAHLGQWAKVTCVDDTVVIEHAEPPPINLACNPRPH